MDHLSEWMTRCAELMLLASAQATVLIMFVLCVQWIARKRISAAWRYALWSIVLARLLIPVFPESRLSLFNVVTPAALRPQQAASSPAAMPPGDVTPGLTVAPAAEPLPAGGRSTALPRGAGPAAAGAPSSPPAPWTVWRVLALVWCAGVLGLAARVALSLFAWYRRGALRREIAEGPLVELLERCREESRLPASVRL